MKLAQICLLSSMALCGPLFAQNGETANLDAASEVEERLSLAPHPLADCEIKRRKLTCEAMRTKGGFIITTNLRDSRRTIQYQIAAFGSVRNNPDFAKGV